MTNLEREIEELILIKELSKKIAKIENKNLVTTKEEIKHLEVKNKIINHIQLLKKAKTAHKIRISYVQILVRLGNIHEAKEMIPINYTLCEFGKWYYGEGQSINDIVGFNEIENVHQKVHDIYLQIDNLYKQRLEVTLFKSVKKLKKQRLEIAKELSHKLDGHSKVLFKYLDLIEKELRRKSVLEFNS